MCRAQGERSSQAEIKQYRKGASLFSMYKLLIIEDDKGIAEAIQTQAEMWELQVHITENFRNVMTEFAVFDPHIVLLDIGLPFFNGYYWCSEIRDAPFFPKPVAMCHFLQ